VQKVLLRLLELALGSSRRLPVADFIELTEPGLVFQRHLFFVIILVAVIRPSDGGRLP